MFNFMKKRNHVEFFIIYFPVECRIICALKALYLDKGRA